MYEHPSQHNLPTNSSHSHLSGNSTSNLVHNIPTLDNSLSNISTTPRHLPLTTYSSQRNTLLNWLHHNQSYHQNIHSWDNNQPMTSIHNLDRYIYCVVQLQQIGGLHTLFPNKQSHYDRNISQRMKDRHKHNSKHHKTLYCKINIQLIVNDKIYGQKISKAIILTEDKLVNISQRNRQKYFKEQFEDDNEQMEKQLEYLYFYYPSNISSPELWITVSVYECYNDQVVQQAYLIGNVKVSLNNDQVSGRYHLSQQPLSSIIQQIPHKATNNNLYQQHRRGNHNNSNQFWIDIFLHRSDSLAGLQLIIPPYYLCISRQHIQGAKHIAAITKHSSQVPTPKQTQTQANNRQLTSSPTNYTLNIVTLNTLTLKISPFKLPTELLQRTYKKAQQTLKQKYNIFPNKLQRIKQQIKLYAGIHNYLKIIGHGWKSCNINQNTPSYNNPHQHNNTKMNSPKLQYSQSQSPYTKLVNNSIVITLTDLPYTDNCVLLVMINVKMTYTFCIGQSTSQSLDDQFDRAYSTHSKQQTDTIELSVCSAVRALTHHKYNVNANTNTNYNFNDNEYYNDNDDEYTEQDDKANELTIQMMQHISSSTLQTLSQYIHSYFSQFQPYKPTHSTHQNPQPPPKHTQGSIINQHLSSHIIPPSLYISKHPQHRSQPPIPRPPLPHTSFSISPSINTVHHIHCQSSRNSQQYSQISVKSRSKHLTSNIKPILILHIQWQLIKPHQLQSKDSQHFPSLLTSIIHTPHNKSSTPTPINTNSHILSSTMLSPQLDHMIKQGNMIKQQLRKLRQDKRKILQQRQQDIPLLSIQGIIEELAKKRLENVRVEKQKIREEIKLIQREMEKYRLIGSGRSSEEEGERSQEDDKEEEDGRMHRRQYRAVQNQRSGRARMVRQDQQDSDYEQNYEEQQRQYRHKHSKMIVRQQREWKRKKIREKYIDAGIPTKELHKDDEETERIAQRLFEQHNIIAKLPILPTSPPPTAAHLTFFHLSSSSLLTLNLKISPTTLFLSTVPNAIPITLCILNNSNTAILTTLFNTNPTLIPIPIPPQHPTSKISKRQALLKQSKLFISQIEDQHNPNKVKNCQDKLMRIRLWQEDQKRQGYKFKEEQLRQRIINVCQSIIVIHCLTLSNKTDKIQKILQQSLQLGQCYCPLFTLLNQPQQTNTYTIHNNTITIGHITLTMQLQLLYQQPIITSKSIYNQSLSSTNLMQNIHNTAQWKQIQRINRYKQHRSYTQSQKLQKYTQQHYKHQHQLINSPIQPTIIGQSTIQHNQYLTQQSVPMETNRSTWTLSSITPSYNFIPLPQLHPNMPYQLTLFIQHPNTNITFLTITDTQFSSNISLPSSFDKHSLILPTLTPSNTFIITLSTNIIHPYLIIKHNPNQPTYKIFPSSLANCPYRDHHDQFEVCLTVIERDTRVVWMREVINVVVSRMGIIQIVTYVGDRTSMGTNIDNTSTMKDVLELNWQQKSQTVQGNQGGQHGSQIVQQRQDNQSMQMTQIQSPDDHNLSWQIDMTTTHSQHTSNRQIQTLHSRSSSLTIILPPQPLLCFPQIATTSLTISQLNNHSTHTVPITIQLISLGAQEIHLEGKLYQSITNILQLDWQQLQTMRLRLHSNTLTTQTHHGHQFTQLINPTTTTSTYNSRLTLSQPQPQPYQPLTIIQAISRTPSLHLLPLKSSPTNIQTPTNSQSQPQQPSPLPHYITIIRHKNTSKFLLKTHISINKTGYIKHHIDIIQPSSNNYSLTTLQQLEHYANTTTTIGRYVIIVNVKPPKHIQTVKIKFNKYMPNIITEPFSFTNIQSLSSTFTIFSNNPHLLNPTTTMFSLSSQQSITIFLTINILALDNLRMIQTLTQQHNINNENMNNQNIIMIIQCKNNGNIRYYQFRFAWAGSG